MFIHFIPHLASQSSATITTEDAVIKRLKEGILVLGLVIGLILKRKTMTRINHYLLYRY
jgi:hypothetical protein